LCRLVIVTEANIYTKKANKRKNNVMSINDKKSILHPLK
jgi:hypothetical protein